MPNALALGGHVSAYLIVLSDEGDEIEQDVQINGFIKVFLEAVPLVRESISDLRESQSAVEDEGTKDEAV